MGRPPLQRSEGRFTPAETGRALAASAARMGEEMHALGRRLYASGQAVSGVLRVSSAEWFTRHVLIGCHVDLRDHAATRASIGHLIDPDGQADR